MRVHSNCLPFTDHAYYKLKVNFISQQYGICYKLQVKSLKRTFDQFNNQDQMSQSLDPGSSAAGSAMKHFRGGMGLREGEAFS